jgi:spermidine synthase
MAREVAKYVTVKEIVVNEISESLVTLAKERLPYWNALGNSAKVKLQYGDAVTSLLNGADDDKYDAIILDLPGPEQLPSIYTQEAMTKMRTRLRPGGALVMSLSSRVCADATTACALAPRLFHTLNATFNSVSMGAVPSALWQEMQPVLVAFNGVKHDLKGTSAADIDARLAAKMTLGPTGVGSLRYYSGRSHQAIFQLPAGYAAFVNDPGRHALLNKEAMAAMFPKPGPKRTNSIAVCTCDPATCEDSSGTKGPVMEAETQREEEETEKDDL